MGNLIETFHIDLKLFIAQVLNFAIVLIVLYFFVFKNLMKVMQERTQKIEKGLEDAKAIEAKLEQSQKEYKEMILDAKKEAVQILENAQKKSDEKKAQILEKTKNEIQVLGEQAKVQLIAEKNKMAQELKQEIVELALLAVEKVLEEKVNSDKDRTIVEKFINNQS